MRVILGFHELASFGGQLKILHKKDRVLGKNDSVLGKKDRVLDKKDRVLDQNKTKNLKETKSKNTPITIQRTNQDQV